MVDEYQDTNFAQYLILKKLSQAHGNLCVVGDDSQSIYAFRGAKIENILNFKKDYPQHHIFRLEQNYRSTQVIVNAANSVIAKNSARIPKECYSRGEEGEKIRLIRAYDEKDEVRSIASSIKSHIYADKAQYQDFAILYRTVNQSRIFEQCLRENNIPHVVYSSPPFLERREVKDVLAFLKLFANTKDDESFKRVISLIPGIGDSTLEVLDKAAKRYSLPLSEVVCTTPLEELGLKTAAFNRIVALKGDLQKYSDSAKNMQCYDFAKEVVLKYNLLSKYKNQTSVDDLARAGNVGVDHLGF